MLAAAAAGRSNEQHPPPHDSIHRPSTANSFKSPKSPHNGRNSTPSISPLSNASKTHNDSANDLVEPITNGAQIHVPDQSGVDHDDGRRDRSSSLSDIEGDFDDQEQDQSGSEDRLTPIGGDENDSEAETERIKPTPQKENRTLEGITNTPLDALREDATSDNDSIGTLEDRDSSRLPTSLAGRKRKRPQPRNASSFAQSDESDSESALVNRREYKKSALELGLQLSTNGDRTEVDEVNGDEAGLEDGDHVPLPEVHSPTKSHKRGKGKAQGKSHKKRQDPVPVEEDAVEADEAGENGDEDEDDSADAADPAELAIREQALHNFQLLAEQFAALRSSIHSEKIAEAEAELAQLQQPHPIHPEFIRQLQAVTARRDTKIQQEMKLHEYKKETLRRSTLASRAQLLSQYMQDAREVRERILYELGKQWYDIQKERRAMQADELDSFGQVFSTKRSVQVRQQAKYNTEVSILSGIAKYVGFPAAPEIVGMPPKDIHDDMKAIRAKLPPKATPYSVQKFGPAVFGPAMPTPTTDPTSDNIAQKEFLEQTPWANPRHPVHAQSRTPSAFGHHGLANHSSPVYGMLGRQTSAFATPQIGAEGAPGSEARPPDSNETVGIPSDPPSSVQPAPPTADRIRLIPYGHGGDTSPTAHVKRAGPVGTKRDFSGLSSASTIDAPADGSVLGEGRTPGMSLDAVPPTQVFATSSLHGQGQESH
ncbi:hypothetical protein B9Z65_4081 [Elsinoe australis]|uniref:Transcriptional regulatory protein DEP1 n=1 Tax=Elsinoe australis TaxID=40998 RepID=A0A2P7Z1S9_9PEZI|nr:hypothetical protein B9Z65_4081 [Elsinoe australis]